TRVEMPRPYQGGTYTQVRTFGYANWYITGVGSTITNDMTSETNPETGTDAKGQQRQYSYDAYGRVTQVRHYVFTNGALQEQLNQRMDYSYDGNPIDAGYSQNAWGRLAAVSFKNEAEGAQETFSYQYSYNQAGRVTNQRLEFYGRPGSMPTQTDNTKNPPVTTVIPLRLEATYAWDTEGRMTSLM